MIGVFAAYEGRNRLGAFCRAFDAFAIAVVGFLAAARLLQPVIGLAPALLSGWLVHVPTLRLLLREPRIMETKAGPAVAENR